MIKKQNKNKIQIMKLKQILMYFAMKTVLPLDILSEGHSDPLSNNLRVKQPELGVTTLK